MVENRKGGKVGVRERSRKGRKRGGRDGKGERKGRKRKRNEKHGSFQHGGLDPPVCGTRV